MVTGGQLRQSRVSTIILYATTATKDESVPFRDHRDVACDHGSGAEGERNEARWALWDPKGVSGHNEDQISSCSWGARWGIQADHNSALEVELGKQC